MSTKRRTNDQRWNINELEEEEEEGEGEGEEEAERKGEKVLESESPRLQNFFAFSVGREQSVWISANERWAFPSALTTSLFPAL
jgi:hypothetical protein